MRSQREDELIDGKIGAFTVVLNLLEKELHDRSIAGRYLENVQSLAWITRRTGHIYIGFLEEFEVVRDTKTSGGGEGVQVTKCKYSLGHFPVSFFISRISISRKSAHTFRIMFH